MAKALFLRLAAVCEWALNSSILPLTVWSRTGAVMILFLHQFDFYLFSFFFLTKARTGVAYNGA